MSQLSFAVLLVSRRGTGASRIVPGSVEGVSALRRAPLLLVWTWRPKHHWARFISVHVHASETLWSVERRGLGWAIEIKDDGRA